MRVLVFNNGVLRRETVAMPHRGQREVGDYIVVIGATRADFTSYTNGWYRADLTPVLLNDVPKEYLTLLLLLT